MDLRHFFLLSVFFKAKRRICGKEQFMSEELLKIADGLLAVSEGVRALAGKAHSCNCSKNQEEERGQKDEESGNEKSQERQIGRGHRRARAR